LLYGRRKGPKLSAHQQRLRATLLPTLTLRLEKNRDPRLYFSLPPRGEVASASERVGSIESGPPLEPASLRSSGPTSPQGGGRFLFDEVWLEVGYGGGEHLLWQAAAHRDVGLIGAEPYESGTAKLLSQLCADAVPNIRIYEDDARDIIEALPDASIGRCFILFPDPWPKTRHHKRRFIQMDTLDQLARILKPGAELRFASDDASYVTHVLERLMAHPEFAWTAQGPADWQGRPADWPPTRYEAKQLHGPPAFLRFVRTGRSEP
jgi:tRNA (guanine-N7-)-methyltransferase